MIQIYSVRFKNNTSFSPSLFLFHRSIIKSSDTFLLIELYYTLSMDEYYHMNKYLYTVRKEKKIYLDKNKCDQSKEFLTHQSFSLFGIIYTLDGNTLNINVLCIVNCL